jgi:hypothetical protein
VELLRRLVAAVDDVQHVCVRQKAEVSKRGHC